MSRIHLVGELRCATQAEIDIVTAHLPEHIQRTRSEPGCLAFSVTPTDDAGVWRVAEEFRDQEAFELHQARVRGSEWGRATAGIERQYEIRGLAG